METKQIPFILHQCLRTAAGLTPPDLSQRRRNPSSLSFLFFGGRVSSTRSPSFLEIGSGRGKESEKMRLKELVKMAGCYSYDLGDSAGIYPVGDLHIGSPSCDMDYVKKLLNHINSSPRLYMIGLGDFLDMGLAGSKSDVYTQTQTPGRAILEVAELLRPLAESGKILALMDGNHEERLSKIAGISPMQMIAELLGIPDRYTPSVAIVRVTVGGHTYAIYASHGSGGGARIGGKAGAIEKLGWISDADIIAAGHTHTPLAFVQDSIRIDTATGEEIQKERLYINCGSCLDYKHSYGAVKGYIPGSKRYPAIELKADFRPAVIL